LLGSVGPAWYDITWKTKPLIVAHNIIQKYSCVNVEIKF